MFRASGLRKKQKVNSLDHKPAVTASTDDTETIHTDSYINMQAHTLILGTNHVYLAWQGWNQTSSEGKIRRRNGQDNRNVEIELTHPHRCENHSGGGGDLRPTRPLFRWYKQRGFTSTQHRKTLRDGDVSLHFIHLANNHTDWEQKKKMTEMLKRSAAKCKKWKMSKSRDNRLDNFLQSQTHHQRNCSIFLKYHCYALLKHQMILYIKPPTLCWVLL